MVALAERATHELHAGAGMRRQVATLVMALAALFLYPRRAESHPLHTTLTEVTTDPGTGVLRLTIRVFADDFSMAASRHAGARSRTPQRVAADVMSRYVMSRLQLVDAGGRRVALAWVGARYEGEMIWITLRAPPISSLGTVAIANALMFEMFDDQVNIVRLLFGDRRGSLLFTTRDKGRVKPLVT